LSGPLHALVGLQHVAEHAAQWEPLALVQDVLGPLLQLVVLRRGQRDHAQVRDAVVGAAVVGDVEPPRARVGLLVGFLVAGLEGADVVWQRVLVALVVLIL
jgi:hypothetical protein